MSLPPGRRLGCYEIIAPLGAGGMGEVYRARDTKLDRYVAVKVLPAHLSQDPEALARFQREARAIAALSHAAIHDFGTHEGTAYAVMELLEGETLRQRLAGGRRCGRLWTSRCRSPAAWRRRTRRGSSTGTSSRRTCSLPV